MENQFAKLFDVQDGHQVLVTKEFNNEDDSFDIDVRTNYGGVKATITGGYDSEAKRDQMFDEYDEVKAREFMQGILNKFSYNRAQCPQPNS